MNKTIHLRAELQHMAEPDMLAMVDPALLARIKLTDERPLIKVFSVGHEGEADGTMVGRGRAVMRYMRDAIEKIGKRLSAGIPIFNRHAATNDHAGREQIGQVVGRSTREIDGRLHALAAVHVFPEHRGKALDVASIETNVVYSLDQDGNGRVDDIEEITGIALSDRRMDAPGFPGATLLGAFQAFAQGNLPDTGGMKAMTIEQIQQAIKDGGFKPSQVFDADALKGDTAVIAHVKAEKQTEYEHAKRLERRLGEEREDRLKAEKELQEKLDAASATATRSRTGDLFAEIATERKLDDKQRSYIARRMDQFKTEAKDEAGLREDLKRFCDGQQKACEEDAKLFGVELKPAPADGGKGGDKGAPPDDGKTPANPNDLADPKVNDFIPE